MSNNHYIKQLYYSVQFSVDTALFPSWLLPIWELVILLSGQNSHVKLFKYIKAAFAK